MMRRWRCHDARVRTTVHTDDRLLAEATLIAAGQHGTIGSVMEDALRQRIDSEAAAPAGRADFQLHTFVLDQTGLLPRVDLEDADLKTDLLDEGADHAPA
jgi:Arc/MetJ family transcription regulator